MSTDNMMLIADAFMKCGTFGKEFAKQYSPGGFSISALEEFNRKTEAERIEAVAADLS